jgi:shikimate dehydrogenase
MPQSYLDNLVAVFGHPVAENPTCVMQEAAFAAAGLHWRYLTLEVKPDDLPDAVRGARALGFKGFNCTIPHKVAVMALLDEISPDAAMIGAVNTVRTAGGVGGAGRRRNGENTHRKGFLRGVREAAKIDPGGKRVTILGAGGAARAIAVELALAGAAELQIYNRSEERGAAMVKDLVARTSARATFRPWGGPMGGGSVRVSPDTDILVNATSIGLYPNTDAMPDVSLDDARPDLLVCDVIPHPPETRLLQEARRRSLKTLNGLAMLVFQGAIGFEMWTGQKPAESAMQEALERAFGLR